MRRERAGWWRPAPSCPSRGRNDACSPLPPTPAHVPFSSIQPRHPEAAALLRGPRRMIGRGDATSAQAAPQGPSSFEGLASLGHLRMTGLRQMRVALIAVLLAIAAPGLARAQNYPTTFDFGTPASAEEIAAVAIAVGADG